MCVLSRAHIDERAPIILYMLLRQTSQSNVCRGKFVVMSSQQFSVLYRKPAIHPKSIVLFLSFLFCCFCLSSLLPLPFRLPSPHCSSSSLLFSPSSSFFLLPSALFPPPPHPGGWTATARSTRV